tara:strand:- start:672 stop:953 length:282 start_codon:yes stop_codon:yes gene_type:complete
MMNAENAVINYFIYKKIGNYGYKYGYYKKIIGYILDTENLGYIRKTFLGLVKSNNFIKIQNGNKKSYLYKFILPNEIKKEKEFEKELFMVSWD